MKNHIARLRGKTTHSARDAVRETARDKVRKIGDHMLLAYAEQYISWLYRELELQRDHPHAIHAAQLQESVSVLQGVVDEIVARQDAIDATTAAQAAKRNDV